MRAGWSDGCLKGLANAFGIMVVQTLDETGFGGVWGLRLRMAPAL